MTACNHFFVNFIGFKSIDPTQYAKPFIGVSPKSLKIFSEKFSSNTSQVVKVEFNSEAILDKEQFLLYQLNELLLPLTDYFFSQRRSY